MTTVLRSLVVSALLLGVATPAGADGTVTVTVTTTPRGGNYAPANVVAIWAQDAQGAFIKTMGRWANARRQHLVAWTTAAGALDVDAVSGATRNNHTAPLTVTWNLRDKANAEIPDGTYTIRMELADQNSNQPDQNHQGTFTFVKGTEPQTQTALVNGGFTNVSITFTPNANSCNNGAVDVGETCDPPGSCPTTCAASTDACAPNQLVGDAQTCTAACMVTAITACVGGDGCCADGCDEASDSDCAAGGAGGGGGSNEIVGGCATGSSGGEPLVLGALGALLLGTRRRRRA